MNIIAPIWLGLPPTLSFIPTAPPSFTRLRLGKWLRKFIPRRRTNFDYHKSDLVCEQKLEPQKKSKTKSKSKSQSRSRSKTKSKTRIRSRSKTRVKSKSKTRKHKSGF